MRILGLIVLMATQLFGQLPDEVLVAAEKKFNALDSYEATIVFSMDGHIDTGKVYVKINRYQLDFPEDQTIFDGTTIMNYSRGFAAVNLSVPSKAPDFSLPGLYKLHQFPFHFALTNGPLETNNLSLTNRDELSNVQKVGIQIGKQSGLIEAYTIQLNTGLKISYQLLDVKINPKLDDQLFYIDMDFVRKVENGEIEPIEHKH